MFCFFKLVWSESWISGLLQWAAIAPRIYLDDLISFASESMFSDS